MALKNGVEEGRYLYCIVKSAKETDFRQIGIEDNIVYIVPFGDIGAVVHHCGAKPYITKDEKKAGEWILAHQYVIDLATEEFGTVIPLTFDIIIRGSDETAKQWLREEYNQLKTLLEKLEGKAEYGVQIFIDKEMVEKASWENKEIQDLKKELERKSEGAAYLIKKKIEKRLKIEERRNAEKHAKTFYDKIKGFVDEVRLESVDKEVPEKWENKQMILNLSCLVRKCNIVPLGKMLNEINRDGGFAVRFTGPWSPYSFVGDIKRKVTV